jgi:hypothetical protein
VDSDFLAALWADTDRTRHALRASFRDTPG